jgi:hypothetical protein
MRAMGEEQKEEFPCMAMFKPFFARRSQPHDTSQPRRLDQRGTPQQCSWTGCATRAVSEHKAQVYCASHLLRTLQQQWQG